MFFIAPTMLGSLTLTSCGGDTSSTLLDPSDFENSKGNARDVGIGIVGMPPCRALRSFNDDLNLTAAGRTTGTTISLEGDDSVFAVVFSKTATPPSATEVLSEATGKIEECAREISGDSSRAVETLDDLTLNAIGFRAHDNNFASEYAYTVTKDNRLLVVGTEYTTGDEPPVSVTRVLKLAVDRAPDIKTPE